MKKQMKLCTLLTKPFVLFVLLFALGVGQMWAGNNCDFWDSAPASITFTANGDPKTMEISGKTGTSDFTDIGTVSSLTISSFWAKTWKKNGNVCQVEMYYAIHTTKNVWGDDSEKKQLNALHDSGYDDWQKDDGTWNQQWLYTGSENILEGLTPGTTYWIDFYFEIQGNSGGSEGCFGAQKSLNNGTNNNYHASFTVADTKTTFDAGEYLYLDARNQSNWQTADFKAKFYFKRYDKSNEDLPAGDVTCDNTEKLDSWVYYAVIPDKDYNGKVQVNRLKPEDGTFWCTTPIMVAADRSDANLNCLGGSGSECDWTPTWTTYCPPMSDVDLEENGTTLSWGGDGSLGDPYLIPTGASIKVKATNATKAVDDDNMTIYYQFKKAGTEVQAGSTTASATITASGSTGTKEAVTVEAYNYYNSTSGTHLASNEIYYEVRTPYTISYNAGTDGSGLRASETKLKGVNFATPNSAIFTRTGYTQTGWATSNGGSQLCALGGNYTSDADATLYPVWTANNYTVTLDNREADKDHEGTGSVSVTFDATTGLTSTIEKPEKAHYDFGGYYVSDDGGETLTNIQLIDANGNWKKGVSGYTGTSEDNATWVYAGDITLYAKWTQHEYTVTIAVTGSGSTSPANSTTAKYVTESGNITATPSTGYSFREWGFSKTDEKYDVYVSDDKTYSSTDATIKINAQHNGTLTANFTANGYTVNLENKGADKDHKGTENVSVTYNAITGLTSAIEKPEKAHYDFGGYYVSNDEGETLTNIQLIDASGNWNKGVSGYTGTSGDYATWVYAGNITLYAKWTETAYTITPSVSPAGTGSVNTVTDAHWITPSSTITATPVNAAWVFDRWEYGEHVGPSTVSGNTVTVTSDMNSTITAHFKPRYELVGSKWNDSEDGGGMPGWTYDGTGEFTVNSFTALGTGEGTGVDLSYSCSLLANTTYNFQVHDRVTGNHGKYYASGQYINDGDHALLNQKDNNVPLAAVGAGTYTFRISNMTYDGTTDDYFPTITVERPHQANFGRRRVDIDGVAHDDNTGGTLAVKAGESAISSGAWVTYNDTVTYTTTLQSGYTQEWYTSSEYSDKFSAGGIWGERLRSTSNVYAQFTEQAKTVTINKTGKGTITVDAAAFTWGQTKTCGVTTTRRLVATADDGYSFSSWTVPDGVNFQLDDKELDTDYDVTLRGKASGSDGTLTANFTETLYTVSVEVGASGGGTIHNSVTSLANVGIDTKSTEVTADSLNPAWHFKEWQFTAKVTPADGYTANSNPIKVNATAALQTITAIFEPRYGLHGSLSTDEQDGMPGWVGDGADFTVVDFDGVGEGDGKGVDLQCTRTLEPNKEYKFRIYDRVSGGRWGYSSETTLGADASLSLNTWGDGSGKDVKINTVGYGTYTFKITNVYDNVDGKYYPKVTVDRPTSYQLNMGCTGGGTVSAYTRNGATPTNYPIVNGQYVSAGDSIVFAAVPAAGYSFEGWHSSDAYNSQFATDPNMHIRNIDATVNTYAKFVPVALTFTNNDGSGDGKWSTASNWSPACVPTLGHDVTIQAPVVVAADHATAKSIVLDQNSHTGKLTIEANKGLEVVGTITRTTDGSNRLATREEDLVLESSSAGNASLIFDNSNSDAATVMMYSKASISGSTWNWQYVGTPFTGSIPQYNYYGSWMYKWNNGSWEVVHGGDELTPFAGYCLTQNSATTHVMGGTLVPTTSKSVTMAASTDMVLANSWTAPINIASFDIEGGDATFTSTPATVYLFNTGMAENGSKEGTEAGTYISVPINSAPYTGNSLIAPMQGFFVTTNGGSSGTITMNYGALVRPSGSHTDIVAGPMKAPKRAQAAETKPEVMKIRANGTQYSDRVVILAREDFSEGFDNGWDGEKLSFGAEAPSVYVINEQGGYDAVSAIPDLEGTVVGFRAGTNNSCTMTFEYDGEEIWYLNDLQTQQSTLIDSELTYTFSTSSYDNEARFIISATPIRKITTGNESVGAEAAKVRKLIINDKLYIIRGGRMYSADGAMIK